MGLHRFDKEENGLDMPLKDLRGNLDVSSSRSVADRLHCQSGRNRNDTPGRSSRDQVKLGEPFKMCFCKLDHLNLLPVMRNERDRCHRRQ